MPPRLSATTNKRVKGVVADGLTPPKHPTPGRTADHHVTQQRLPQDATAQYVCSPGKSLQTCCPGQIPPGPQTLVLTPRGALSFVHRIRILPGHPDGFIEGRAQRD